MRKFFNWKLWTGVLVGALFLYLAFRNVEFGRMWASLRSADYHYLLPATLVLFFSHFLRAFRWRYLLDPIRRVDTPSLFSSLIIGYGANTVTPAHLGEFLRAYVLSQKRGIPMGAVFATVVTERIIDVFSLLLLMSLAVSIHPFPEWVVKSGYIMFGATLALFLLLILGKRSLARTDALLRVVLKPLPGRIGSGLRRSADRFFSGILPLNRRRDYVTVAILSALIWACYGLVFYFCFHAFDFIRGFDLPGHAALILLVVTTISVVVPSSPGYVGPYHYLCQVSLAMFGVPESPALSYAVVVHAVNILPVLGLAMGLAGYEGVRVFRPEIR